MMSFGNTQEWHLELDEARPIVDRALDAGINFFDTANVYSRGRSEEITGELLSEHRDDVVIASKIRFKMGEGVVAGLADFDLHGMAAAGISVIDTVT